VVDETRNLFFESGVGAYLLNSNLRIKLTEVCYTPQGPARWDKT
jgi:hypothetical protein